MIETGLKNRVVLVTGANNPFGIGAGTARAFAAQGARVFLHYLRYALDSWKSCPPRAGAPRYPGEEFYFAQQDKTANAMVDEIRSSGGQAETCEADLSDAGVIPMLFDRAERTLGPVEILVNNAAYWEADTFVPPDGRLRNELVELWTHRPENITPGSFDRLFAVNPRAPALLIAEFARRHIERGANWGRVISISTAGAYCFPSEISYGASKLALESYTRSAASELGQFGVTVNAVSLGPVQTGWITAELEKQILPTIPLGRIGTPEDVADVIVFLASTGARWVTGQRIYVGGGHGM